MRRLIAGHINYISILGITLGCYWIFDLSWKQFIGVFMIAQAITNFVIWVKEEGYTK